MSTVATKLYDRAYFERWYRDDVLRDDADVRELAGQLLAVTATVLGRPAETVLDVGCGEGRVQLRPQVTNRRNPHFQPNEMKRGSPWDSMCIT